jgi:hypothetical protein
MGEQHRDRPEIVASHIAIIDNRLWNHAAMVNDPGFIRGVLQ